MPASAYCRESHSGLGFSCIFSPTWYTFCKVQEQPPLATALVYSRQGKTCSTCGWLREGGWGPCWRSVCELRSCVCPCLLCFLAVIPPQKNDFVFFCQRKTYITCGGYALFGEMVSSHLHSWMCKRAVIGWLRRYAQLRSTLFHWKVMAWRTNVSFLPGPVRIIRSLMIMYQVPGTSSWMHQTTPGPHVLKYTWYSSICCFIRTSVYIQ